MIFNFHHSKTLLGFFIRFFSLGHYNHVSIRLGNYIYEATIKGGVIKTHYKKWNSDTVVERIKVPLTIEQERNVRLWLNEQVGKGYDITGVMSFLWIFMKESVGKWFCSEIGFVSLMKAWGVDSSVGYNQRVSPQQFYEQLLVLLFIKYKI